MHLIPLKVVAVTTTVLTKPVLRVQLAEKNMILGRMVRQRRFELGEMVPLDRTMTVGEYNQTMAGSGILAVEHSSLYVNAVRYDFFSDLKFIL